MIQPRANKEAFSDIWCNPILLRLHPFLLCGFLSKQDFFETLCSKNELRINTVGNFELLKSSTSNIENLLILRSKFGMIIL